LILEIAGIIRKAKGSWHLTKKGEKMVKPEQRKQLFRAIFETFIAEFNWSYHDGYDNLPPYFAAFSATFSLSMLSNFGAQDRPSDFYAEKYTTAFPSLLNGAFSKPYFSVEESATSCYYIRFFARFTYWFGLAIAVEEYNFMTKAPEIIRTPPVLDHLFSFPAMVERGSPGQGFGDLVKNLLPFLFCFGGNYFDGMPNGGVALTEQQIFKTLGQVCLYKIQRLGPIKHICSWVQTPFYLFPGPWSWQL
jgi:hypothetical protein